MKLYDNNGGHNIANLKYDSNGQQHGNNFLGSIMQSMLEFKEVVG